MKLIITSCGLSLLTNYFENIRHQIYTYANSKEDELQNQDKDFINLIKNNRTSLLEKLKNSSTKELKKSSAELNSILTFYENSKKDPNDFHYIIHTDTFLGEFAADIIKEFITEKLNITCAAHKAKDLNTKNVNSFRWGLTELARHLSETIDSFKESKHCEIIFNLTGGFKSVNSFLQTMASLYADKSIYIFEQSSTLLVIPRMPIIVDYEIFENNLEIFRKIEHGIPIKNKDTKAIHEALFIEIDNQTALSEWGEIVWQKAKKEIYSKKLLNPLFNNITFSNTFKKQSEKLSNKELFELNKSIDELSSYLKRTAPNLRSLRFHDLKGKISEDFGYEFYPFDGKDSRRVFCNMKEKSVILEKFDSHLK